MTFPFISSSCHYFSLWIDCLCYSNAYRLTSRLSTTSCCPDNRDLIVIFSKWTSQMKGRKRRYLTKKWDAYSELRDVILSLYLTLLRPHLDYSMQLWGSHQNNRDLLEWVQRATKRIRGLEHLPCAERNWGGGLLGLEKRKLQGRYPAAAPLPKGVYKRVGEGLFTWVCGVGTRGWWLYTKRSQV